MIESVNALCWNPLELFCLFGEESMEIPIIPVEPVEERIIKDDVTDCLNGACSATLGKVRFAPYKGEWYEIEKSPSLNESSRIKCVVESDSVHLVNCIDFNYTHRLIDVSINDISLINKDIPIKVLRINQSYLDKQLEEGKEIDKNKIYFTISEINYKFKDLKEIKQEWINADFRDVIKFGKNSTTIILQNNITENLNDAYVSKQSPTTNYGSTSPLNINANTGFGGRFNRIYIVFNISLIPASSTINFASLYLYEYGVGTTTNGGAYHVINYNQSETTITWNKQPCGIIFDNSVNCNLTSESSRNDLNVGVGWKIWNLTSAVTRSYNSNGKNVSFALKSTEDASASADNFYSKEYVTDTTLRPYLNITYTETPTDTTPPTYASQAKNITTFLTDSSVQFNATISDASNVNNWTFSWNATEGNAWNNITNSSTGLAVSSIIASANHSLISKTIGDVFGYMFCSADALNNIGCDAISTFTIQASNTCSCPTSGDWNIKGSDNCVITADCNLQGNKFNMVDAGTLTIHALIYNYQRPFVLRPTANCHRVGGCFG